MLGLELFDNVRDEKSILHTTYLYHNVLMPFTGFIQQHRQATAVQKTQICTVQTHIFLCDTKSTLSNYSNNPVGSPYTQTPNVASPLSFPCLHILRQKN